MPPELLLRGAQVAIFAVDRAMMTDLAKRALAEYPDAVRARVNQLDTN